MWGDRSEQRGEVRAKWAWGSRHRRASGEKRCFKGSLRNRDPLVKGTEEQRGATSLPAKPGTQLPNGFLERGQGPWPSGYQRGRGD